jgi:hypothetical protein
VSDAFKPLFAAADDKMQQELGDLELTVADKQKHELLLGLQQPALLRFLGDGRTRVASENTVFSIVNAWWHRQKQQRQQQQQQQLPDIRQQGEMLLRHVRMKVRAPCI